MTDVHFMTQVHYMKKITRKEREKKLRKERIIDAAEQVIDSAGFENATMDEIAEKAELAKGTLYLYFKNKTAIYLAICQRGSGLLNQKLGQVLTRELSGLELIREMGHAYLNFIKENPLYFTAFGYYESILDEDQVAESEIAKQCQEQAKEAMAFIVRALQIGIQDGSIKDDIDPQELGLIIWGASRGVMHMGILKQKRTRLELLDQVEFDTGSLVSNFIKIIGTGIKK